MTASSQIKQTENISPLSAQKPRMEWLDALRGFTMILVVMNHVMYLSFCYKNYGLSSPMAFLTMMRMPMFFFLSGFLAYKANQLWSFANTKRIIGKKIRVQMVPTIVFFFAIMVLLHPRDFLPSVEAAYHSSTKGGYWFTLVLLYMFLVYYVFEYIEHLFKKQSLWHILALWFFALGISETCYLPRLFAWAAGHRPEYTGWLCDTSVIEFMRHFQFFVFGNIVHRYWHKFESLCNKPRFYPLVVLVAFACCAEYLKLHWLRMEYANISHTLAQYSLVALFFLCFRHYKNTFSMQTRAGRCLQYVGTRTLDVYLLHYFFLPHLPEIGEYFHLHPNNFAIQFVASLLVALIVIAFSLVVSNILRVSPLLKKHLFGREK